MRRSNRSLPNQENISCQRLLYPHHLGNTITYPTEIHGNEAASPSIENVCQLRSVVEKNNNKITAYAASLPLRRAMINTQLKNSV
jgi:hypothetical protein